MSTQKVVAIDEKVGWGSRLRAFRTAIGAKNQEEMAYKLGVSARAYPNYEQEVSEVSFAILLKLRQLGLNIDWLITGKGDMLIDDFLGRLQAERDCRIQESSFVTKALQGMIEKYILDLDKMKKENEELKQRLQK